MTPAATTPAARRARPSGPTRRSTGAAGAATAPPRPRRVSGPATAPRPRRTPGPGARPTATPGPAHRLGARALRALQQLPDHPLLDRLIRGRVWIALLGIMLVGIVAMQVEVLKLGAGVGRNLDLATTLQTHNETLRTSVAELADDGRIEALAARQGMVMPAPSSIAFVDPASDATMQRAVSAIHAPAPSTFLSATTGNGAVVTAADAAAAGGTSVGQNSADTTAAPVVPAAPADATSAAPSAASAAPAAVSTASSGAASVLPSAASAAPSAAPATVPSGGAATIPSVGSSASPTP